MALWKGRILIDVVIKDYVDSKFTHRAELDSLDTQLSSNGLKITRIESRIGGVGTNAAIRFTPNTSHGSKSFRTSIDVSIESYPDTKFPYNIRLLGFEEKLKSEGWSVKRTSCRNEKWIGDLAIRANIEGLST
jgi:hypothetical protein